MSGNPLFRQKALDKLRSPEELDQLMTITSPRGWLVLLAFIILLVVAALWGVLATIQTSVSGSGILASGPEDSNRLEAVVYVSIEDGERIQPGMSATISPATVRREEYGLIQGKVLTVDRAPSTQADMIDVLGNDALVQFLASAGQIIEVHLELDINPLTPSGYQWTSVAGPPNSIQGDTLCDGSVIISKQHPIELVFASR